MADDNAAGSAGRRARIQVGGLSSVEGECRDCSTVREVTGQYALTTSPLVAATPTVVVLQRNRGAIQERFVLPVSADTPGGLSNVSSRNEATNREDDAAAGVSSTGTDGLVLLQRLGFEMGESNTITGTRPGTVAGDSGIAANDVVAAVKRANDTDFRETADRAAVAESIASAVENREKEITFRILIEGNSGEADEITIALDGVRTDTSPTAGDRTSGSAGLSGFQSLPRFDAAMLNAGVQDGDVAEFTRLEQMPVVLAGVLAPALHQAMQQQQAAAQRRSEAANRNIFSRIRIPIVSPTVSRVKNQLASMHQITIEQRRGEIPVVDQISIGELAGQLVPPQTDIGRAGLSGTGGDGACRP
ncbi:MAG: hypothetical protein R3C19_14150 [Planctomycetaceae bacterium]